MVEKRADYYNEPSPIFLSLSKSDKFYIFRSMRETETVRTIVKLHHEF